jgi:hypothetical protein
MRGERYSGNDVQVKSSSVANTSELDQSVFYQDGDALQMQWGRRYTYNSTAELSSFPGGANNKLEDPLFVDRAAGDFRLGARSPAIDICAESSVYRTFELVFGESIRFDFAGGPRPQGSGWDAGAYEAAGEAE